MRSEDPSPGGSTLARLRARCEPARRWLSGRDSGPRRALALAAPLALAVLVGLAYFASSDEPVARVLLYKGRRFDREAIPKVLKALSAKGIDGRADEGRVGVASRQEAEAVSILEAANLGPNSPVDAINQPTEQGPFEPFSTFIQKVERKKLRFLEEMVHNLDPAAIDRVHIELFRPKSGGFPRRLAEPKATVFLFTESSRPVPPRTLAAIQRLLVGTEPDLKPESITILGDKGVPYVIQGNSSLLAESQAQARSEELAGQVQDKLRWIEGVRVWVRIDPAESPAPRHAPEPMPEPATPIVAPNAAMSLPVDELPTAVVSAPAPPSAPPDATGRVIVFVQVPVSHYLRGGRPGDADREVSGADLRAYAEKVENSIRAAVRHVAPTAKAEDVTISRIDAIGPDVKELASSGVRKFEPGWAVAGVVGLLVAVVVGSLRAGRKPSARPSRPSRRRRYDRALGDEGQGAGPAPSERVRELVRMDPEAAAGVLQRWIGQGGDSA